jgi:YD repeat-containing protein
MLCRSLRSLGSHCSVIAVVLLGPASMLWGQSYAAPTVSQTSSASGTFAEATGAPVIADSSSTGPFAFAYDEAGRLVGVADAAGNTATYTYDAAGNVLSIRRGSSAVSILAFSPSSGPVGTNVTIVGAGFGATVAENAVTFNGVSATVVTATRNQLVAVVPVGATTGPIRVTSPAGSAVSATPFTVGPNNAPSISGFTPGVGTAGSTVTITGTNFEPMTGNNRVSFNGNLGAVSSATATTLGSVVPSTATSGHITVSTPYGHATSTSDFFVPPSPYTAADVEVTGRMAIGETRTVTITQANKIGMILFSGSAGQRISLGVSLGTGLASGNCDSVSIRRPDGAYLVSSTSMCGSSGFIDRQILPVSGTYLITCDPGGTDTGSATLTLYNVPADATAGIVAGGSPVTVTTTTPGQNAVVTFSGFAGQRVSLKVSFGSGLTAACNSLSIQNPDGTPLLSQTMCSPSYFSDVRVLPATGVYTITVNPGEVGVGSTTLTLYNVPPDATAGIVAGGSPVTVTTTTPGQNAVVTFSGFAGQRVSLNVSFGSGLTVACNSLSIQNPDGTPFLSQTVCSPSYFSDMRVLPATGVYTITVNPGEIGVGSTTLTLYNVPADATASIIAGGSPVTVTTTTPGQNAVVTFSGSVGQRVSLKVSFGSGLTAACNSLSIQNPDGTPFLSQTLCGSSYFSDVRVLPATGVYTITVNPGEVGVGSTTLTLYNVPADATAGIVAGGSPVTVTTTTPGQNAVVTFSGSGGQRVSLNVSFGSGLTAVCNSLSLQNPDSTPLLSQTVCSPSYFSDVLVLSATGVYTITVNPGEVGVGSTTLTLYNVPPDVTRTIIVGGPAASVTTTVPGQNATVTFSGLAAQSVTVRMTGNTMGLVTVTLRKPDGSTQTSSSSSAASFNLAPQTLPVAGTYTIFVNPNSTSTGSINVATTSP